MKHNRLGPNTNNSVALNGATPSAWGNGQFALEAQKGALFFDTAGTLAFHSNCFSNAAYEFRYRSNGAAFVFSLSSGSIGYSTSPTGTGGDIVPFTTRFSVGSEGNVFIGNSSSVPGSNPVGGGYLYVESGALKYRGSSGTVTTIAPA
jgi:hypothetical protein